VHFHLNGSKGMDKKIFTQYREMLKEKYLKEGYCSLTETEKAELLLSYCGCDSESCKKLMSEFGSLDMIFDAELNYLKQLEGMDIRSAVLLRLIPELSRYYASAKTEIKCLNTTKKARMYFENYFTEILNEHVAIVCVDERMNIISSHILNAGTEKSVNIDSKSILNEAVSNRSNYVFIAHNHVKSGPEPSHSDYAVTDLLSKNLELFGVYIVDHIIVGRTGTVSMRELEYTLEFKKKEIPAYVSIKSD